MSIPDSQISSLTLRDRIAILRIDSPPVNALGIAVRVAIADGLEVALADDDADAVVIICAGRTFFAGADISELGKPFARPHLSDIFVVIEASQKPVIAAIHGTALGGGLELALACHARIAVTSAQLGLPEVALGLLPGAGGTQRTPRAAGVALAIDLIASGRPIGAKAAQTAGLIDEVCEDGILEDEAIVFAKAVARSAVPLRRIRDLKPDLDTVGAAAHIAEYRAKNPKQFIGFKAPNNILKAIEASVTMPFDDGLAREAELFDDLVASREAKAQIYQFFAARTVTKIPGLAANLKPLPIATVAVIGAGTMGSGISMAFLNAGLPVTLIDTDRAAVERGAGAIAYTLDGAVAKGRMSEAEAERRKALLETATDLVAAQNADLVVEAVYESLDLKKQIFAKLDELVKPGAVLASNTSFLDLNAIAAATSRPEQVIGLHFFAPANIMRLLEVVRGNVTSDAVLATGMAIGRKLGKTAVFSGVCHGFIANRMMEKRGEAADRLLLEGPLPWEVDSTMLAYGFPMGPFAMMDLVGLDVIGWDREHTAGRTVQELLCEAGRWGQKRNGGYYDYDERKRASPSPTIEEMIRTFADKSGLPRKNYSAEEIVERLLYPVVNEGAKILEEGIALRASDIDVALVAGYGWPIYTGGPMFWGETVGLKNIVDSLDAAGHAGVSPLLRRLAKKDGSFNDLL